MGLIAELNRRNVIRMALLYCAASWLVLNAVASPDARSIAVLPFVNMSADPANEYLSEGPSKNC